MKVILPFVTLTLAGLVAADVVKRSDDVSPLQVVVNNLSQDVTTLLARITALENSIERKASFLGQLPTTTDGRTNVPNQVPIHFSEVFDLGDGFNPVTGVYTAKYSGVYVINFQMYPDFTNEDFQVDLKMNGNLLVRSRTTEVTTYAASVSSGVSVRVRAGDQLWVETSREGIYWGSVHSFLSITLVTPEA
ncbi:uncharacterized protein LOC112553689 [Pomacea canaliculata]|uniref:uncharacterized protein LOC112553689 n=1 Tax=Pomacea canaliculata TaxID=400727 RepID=UPI000D73159D|nr:uncharacterized protein LOC112553689 [Pomacea canaliculata]